MPLSENLFSISLIIVVNLLLNFLFNFECKDKITLIVNKKSTFISLDNLIILKIVYTIFFLILVNNLKAHELQDFKHNTLDNIKLINNNATLNPKYIQNVFIDNYSLIIYYIIFEIVLEKFFGALEFKNNYSVFKNILLLLKSKLFRWTNVYLMYAFNSLILFDTIYTITIDNFYKIYTVSEVTLKNVSNHIITTGNLKYIQKSIDSRYSNQADCVTSYLVPQLLPKQNCKFVFMQNTKPSIDKVVVEELAVDINLDDGKKIQKIIKFPFLYNLKLIQLDDCYERFKHINVNEVNKLSDKDKNFNLEENSDKYFIRLRYYMKMYDFAILKYFLNNIQNQNCYNKEIIVEDNMITVKPIP